MAALLSEGQSIRGFRITKAIIPPGQYCNSYFAIQESSGTDVFLKQYTEPTKKGSRWYSKFLRLQEDIQRRLDSIPMPELVEKTISVFEDESSYFQVKELVTGKDLSQLIEINAPGYETTREEKAYLFEDKQWYVNAALMMEAIKQIHAAGVIHTDLKPANVFMTEVPYKVKFRAKVIDFDFCRIEGQKSAYPQDEGGPGTVGTLTYMSPEHIQGKDPEFGSDIFTCGIILYELLCGGSPFYKIYESIGTVGPEELNSAILKAVQSCDFPAPESMNDDLAGTALAEIMKRMLAFSLSDRPSAAEVHGELLKYLGGGGKAGAKRINLRTSDGRYKSVFSDTIITHENARIFGTGYKYVDQEQFQVFKDREEGKWKIKGLTPVVNNTRLNGAVITGQTVEIEDGDVIGVADLKLTVDFIT